MPTFEIICLANSRKLRGRCVAGLRTDGGGWIRPVAPSDDGTLFGQHYSLDNGSEAQILDLIRIEVSKAEPQAHQPENCVIGNSQWTLLARPASPQHIKLITRSIESGPALFGDYRDRMDFYCLCKTPATRSLCVVQPQDLKWRITKSIRGYRQTRAIFRLTDRLYDLSFTGPIWETRLSRLAYGIHDLESADCPDSARLLFTISLGEPLPSDKQCYKLVAGVILAASHLTHVSSWMTEDLGTKRDVLAFLTFSSCLVR